MEFLHAVILAIVEGLTEFLPVSSTGHMIIAESFMGMTSTGFTKAFIVNIQFGAILSVLVLYWKRFFQSIDIYVKLFVAFLPAAVIGFLAGDLIDSMLENITVVALSLFAGGIIFLFIDKWTEGREEEKKSNTSQISYLQALVIGLFQCVAMVPGVSRSAATIIGGMFQGLNRKAAAEFSFLLAVPTMFAASAYKLLKDAEHFTSENMSVLLVGNLVAFVVAILAIKLFIAFLTKYGFKPFGYYRIALGGLLLALMWMGYEMEVV
ncbi:MAG: undecaprenyl-diphosphate phosphatase [Bacteroidota bacterium]